MYVTNKTNSLKHLFVRLRGNKLGDTDLYSKVNHQLIDAEAEGDLLRQQERRLFATMTSAEFRVLRPGIPKAFPVENRDFAMYVCIHDGVSLLVTDMSISPSEYGCIAITGESGGIHIQPSNPEPVWLPCKQSDPLPRDIMKAKKIDSSREMYFGRSQGTICFVDVKDGFCDSWISMFDGKYKKMLSGELLKDTGYDIFQARRGDPLPPNTLQVDGVYVGRNHGDYLCPVDVRDGKVRDFLTIFKLKLKKGEIVVMTNDPNC